MEYDICKDNEKLKTKQENEVFLYHFFVTGMSLVSPNGLQDCPCHLVAIEELCLDEVI